MPRPGPGVDLTRRARDPELLDLGVEPEEVQRSLADLRFVNRWLGNRATLLRAVRSLCVGAGPFRLLDVGSGSGDLPAFLAAQIPGLTAVALDIKPDHLRTAPPPLARVVASVHALPFAAHTFDVVTASLFLHHFDEEELPPLLAALFELSRCGLVINDLRRARLPYAFGTVAFPLMFGSRVSVEDGLVSIRRGFREEELEQALRAAGLRGEIGRSWPYRLTVVVRRA